MDLHLSKRALVRAVTFLTALVVVLGAALGVKWVENSNFRRARTYTYQQSVEDLYSRMSGIRSSLTKGVYCASPQMLSTLAATLQRDAGFAKVSLAALPVDFFELEKTNKFISQVGDFSVSLAKKVSNGEGVTEKEAETLRSMREYCTDLLGSLFVLQEIVRQGQLDFDAAPEGRETESLSAVGDGFREFEDSLGEFPSLIYDGPFSDHILQKEPLMLKGQGDVTREQARAAAAKACGLPAEELEDAGDEEGLMPSYCFASKDGEINVGVTKAGGFITYFTARTSEKEQKLGTEEGIRRAKDYLEKNGITSMRTSYHEIADGILTVNFAYEENGVVCYPDLVKVSVSLEDGTVVGFHQRGYLSNHRGRDLRAPSLSEAEAAKKVSPLLTVGKTNLAVIPTQGLNEVFCYEFSCKGQEDEDILVYINAETGVEEQLLILITGENGTLTV